MSQKCDIFRAIYPRTSGLLMVLRASKRWWSQEESRCSGGCWLQTIESKLISIIFLFAVCFPLTYRRNHVLTNLWNVWGPPQGGFSPVCTSVYQVTCRVISRLQRERCNIFFKSIILWNHIFCEINDSFETLSAGNLILSSDLKMYFLLSKRTKYISVWHNFLIFQDLNMRKSWQFFHNISCTKTCFF